jgi:predicted nucleotidyltransferase
MMVREKVSRNLDEKNVVYDEYQWSLLRKKREKAKKILEDLNHVGVEAIVHGSVARGDVNKKSDIDIVIPNPLPSYKLEIALERAGYHIYQKQVIQATPTHTPKAYMFLEPNEEVVISFPLSKLLTREYEFYRFGGIITLKDIKEEKRVAGINKRLELIIPTEYGHKVLPVIGNESYVASKLGISIDTVMERVRVLTRRDQLGRTGVYFKYTLLPEESVEEALRSLLRKNPYLRKILEKR